MHRAYMRRALGLAALGLGTTAPNPAVGAVVVRDGRIVGEGYHRAAGQPHAEPIALQAAGSLARGADLYVTLEPCCHHGRTPPCTEAILEAGIRRVFYACADPDPRCSGCGHAALVQGGCEVFVGPMTHGATYLNRAYSKHKATGLPYLTLKMAMTADGRVATDDGESKWITGPEARRVVHTMRSHAQVLMVGVGTMLADDPSLTTRIDGEGHHCDALIVDTSARTPATARALNRDDGTKCSIACTEAALPAAENLRTAGAELLALPEADGHVDLSALMRELGNRDIMSVLCEGGPTLAGALIAEQLVDEVVLFIAPKLLGQGPSPLRDIGVETLSGALELDVRETRMVGADMMLRGTLCSRA